MDAQHHPQLPTLHGATALSFVFLVVSLGGLASFLNVTSTFTFDRFGIALRDSAWTVTALINYLSGAGFTALFIWMRNGPRLLIFHPKLIALFFPLCTGNFFPLLYMSFLLSKGDAVSAFVPFSTPDHVPIFEPPARLLVTKTIAGIFAGFIILTGATAIRALVVHGITNGLNDFRALYFTPIQLDLTIGLFFPIVFICVRERGKLSRTIPWVAAILILGNIATCLYAIKIAHESLNFNSSFRHLLLSQSPVIV